MKTKLETLKEHMAEGRYREAIAIAARFPRLGDAEVAIRRAAACILSPAIYREMGINPDEAIALGLASICRRYGTAKDLAAIKTWSREAINPKG